jgi:hypothetical protein
MFHQARVDFDRRVAFVSQELDDVAAVPSSEIVTFDWTERLIVMLFALVLRKNTAKFGQKKSIPVWSRLICFTCQ